jgi:hypothetical protein
VPGFETLHETSEILGIGNFAQKYYFIAKINSERINIPMRTALIGVVRCIQLKAELGIGERCAAKLTAFDIVVAQLEEAMGRSLHDLVNDLRKRCCAIEEYHNPEDFVLSVSALWQGRAPGRQTYLANNFGRRLLENWDRLLEGAERATAFLEEERVFDAKRLPTDVVVPVLAALWAMAPRDHDGEAYARTLLRKYLWRAFFTRRYEASTTARSFNDFNELKSLIAGQITAPVIFDDTKYPLPTTRELLMAGWPTKKDRLVRAILALALREGGKDLLDGRAVSRTNLARRQYHQLFSKDYLQLKCVPNGSIDVALNCALVTWRTTGTEPERYLTERRQGLGESEVRDRLSSHLIPYDDLLAGNYWAFLARRAELIHAAMLSLCNASLGNPECTASQLRQHFLSTRHPGCAAA